MNILMHLCCAPCAVYPVQALSGRGMQVTGFWFNPNIHPNQEYRQRLEGVRKLQALWNMKIEFLDQYGLIEFLRAVAGREETRCEYCYTIRLEETAKQASAGGFDAFTTSLLVSPYQKSGIIKEAGMKLQAAYGVPFIDEDFSPGYREGRRIARELDLYRQQYCGCIYSEMERFVGS
jgi:predicted adenine nucleotide alpha hydrolase (AANH) superfamily ATPase